MKTIWKFPLEPRNHSAIEMPKGARIIAVQTQQDEVCLWALLDSEEKGKKIRKFAIFGTGHHIADLEGKKYIGTVQQSSGLVWHIFEE